MASKTYLAFNFLIHSICIALAIFMSAMLVLKYLKNEDTPKISYKTFDESLEDVYPEITICFKQSRRSDTIYKEKYLKEHNLDGPTYHGYLQGDNEFWKKQKLVESSSKIDFDLATFGLKKFVDHYNATYHDNSFYSGPSNAFNVTFQVPGKKCFTRKSLVHQSQGTLFRETMILDLTATSANVYLHFPEQVLRSVFGKGVSWKSVFTINKDIISEGNSFAIQLSQIDVIKRRPDGKVPCNQNLADDIRLWKEISQRVGCFSPYWKKFIGTDISLKQCTTKEELSSIYKMATANRDMKKDILGSVVAPCNEIRTRVNIKPIEQLGKWSNHFLDLKDNKVFLRFEYLTDDYQELKNEQDFDMEMLWSGIGGFLGIFAGYGLLQVLVGVLDGISHIKSSADRPNK